MENSGPLSTNLICETNITESENVHLTVNGRQSAYTLLQGLTPIEVLCSRILHGQHVIEQLAYQGPLYGNTGAPNMYRTECFILL